MSTAYDVAIVGGRCAGAPPATHLARAGLRVCVIDKARFPSDTASTHIIQPRGTAALERLGVAGALRDADAAQLRRLTMHYDGVDLQLADLLAGARRVGPMRVVPDWHGYFRTATGPGWVLAGDAGNFKDPSAAQGITDALRQAETPADAVLDGLDGDGLDTRLRRWWRWRDRDCRDMHWFAAAMGAAGPTGPLMRELLRDLAARDGGLPVSALLNRDLRSTDLMTPRRIAGALTRVAAGGPKAVLPLLRESAGLVHGQLRSLLSARRSSRSKKPPVGSSPLTRPPTSGESDLLTGAMFAAPRSSRRGRRSRIRCPSRATWCSSND